MARSQPSPKRAHGSMVWPSLHSLSGATKVIGAPKPTARASAAPNLRGCSPTTIGHQGYLRGRSAPLLTELLLHAGGIAPAKSVKSAARGEASQPGDTDGK